MKKRLLPVLLPDEGDRSRKGAYPTLAIKSFPYSEQASQLVWIPEREFGMMPYKAHFLYLLDPSAPISTNNWLYHQHHPDGIYKNEGKTDPQEVKKAGWVKVVATNDPALNEDGVLKLQESFLIDYSKVYHAGTIITAEYTKGYIQDNNNGPDEEYHTLAQDEKGCIVLEFAEPEYETVSVGEETVKIFMPTFDKDEQYVVTVGKRVPGFLLDAPIPDEEKTPENIAIYPAKKIFPFPPGPNGKLALVMAQSKVHAERKGFVTGYYMSNLMMKQRAELLLSQSFEGWTEEAINGYKTAITSITGIWNKPPTK